MILCAAWGRVQKTKPAFAALRRGEGKVKEKTK